MKSEILKTIVKLPDNFRKMRRFTGAVGSDAVEAMHRLMVMVEKVSSPEGGWPAFMEPTPENLLPYLTEEVCEVVQALNGVNQDCEGVVIFSSRYVLIEDLVRRLLWFLARSSPDIMRLVGGVQAEVKLDVEEDWKIGILRLVPVLQVKTAEGCWGVDLGTGEVFDGGQFTPRLIKFKGCFLGLGCVFSENFLQTLQHIILRAYDKFDVFFEGFVSKALFPKSQWVSGEFGVSLSWDFLEGVMDLDDNFKGLDEGLNLQGSVLANNYFEGVMKDCLMGLPVDNLAVKEAEKVAALMVDCLEGNALKSEVLDVVNVACYLRDFSQKEKVLLEDFRHRLLWQIIGCSEVVMQLVGGVRGRILQPQFGWRNGLFCLMPVLVIKERSSGKWKRSLDLRTGEVLVLRGMPVFNEAMVQSCECGLLRDLVPVGNLMRWLRKQVLLLPEVGCLLKGCEVDYWGSGGEKVPVIVKLGFAWRLVDDYEPKL